MKTVKFPRTLCWKNGKVRIIDQTLLPEKLVYLDIADPKQMYDAIRRLAVRGAPAIGCAAAYGCLLGMLPLAETSTEKLLSRLVRDADYLAQSRPTAVNLFWALDRMKAKAAECAALAPGRFKAAMLAEAKAVQAEDAAMCARIGENAQKILPRPRKGRPLGILTHCNAGALATGGMGTALAVIYKAVERGIPLTVFADETRPLLQGARLTAWELTQAGIPVTVICDNMAAQVMREGRVDMVVVGADRIAANGDAANKIGTSGVAILAQHFHIPFFVAAPTSTFDLSRKNGREIPIEQRDASEVRAGFGRVTAPARAAVYNPAFDVTPAEYIRGIITEKGVIGAPDADKIAKHFRK